MPQEVQHAGYGKQLCWELELQEGVNCPWDLFSPLAQNESLPLSGGKRNFLILSLMSPSWWGRQEGEQRF